MTSRKGQSDRETKARLDTVLAILSGNPVPLNIPGLVAVLREAGYEIDDETPKKWGERGVPERWARRIASFPRAQAAALTADWIRDGIGPGPIRTGRNAPYGEGSAAAGPTTTRVREPHPGDATGRPVPSDSIRVEERRALLEGARVLADRIAGTVRTTILRHEMGYTSATRAVLADSLEVFARDLNHRCGENVSGDIWEVVAWLRKPERRTS